MDKILCHFTYLVCIGVLHSNYHLFVYQPVYRSIEYWNVISRIVIQTRFISSLRVVTLTIRITYVYKFSSEKLVLYCMPNFEGVNYSDALSSFRDLHLPFKNFNFFQLDPKC